MESEVYPGSDEAAAPAIRKILGWLSQGVNLVQNNNVPYRGQPRTLWNGVSSDGLYEIYELNPDNPIGVAAAVEYNTRNGAYADWRVCFSPEAVEFEVLLQAGADWISLEFLRQLSATPFAEA